MSRNDDIFVDAQDDFMDEEEEFVQDVALNFEMQIVTPSDIDNEEEMEQARKLGEKNKRRYRTGI